MRKSNMRKWFHLIIDFIPLFIIPIFAININQKNVEPISITVGGDYVVKNKYETNEINNYDDLQLNKIYHLDSLYLNSTNADGYEFTLYIFQCESYQFYQSGNQYFSQLLVNNFNSNNSNYLELNYMDNEVDLSFTNSKAYADVVLEDIELSFNNIDFIITTGLQDFILQCEDNLLNPYESTYKVLEYIYEDEIVYDNTDIGSQFLYSLYKPVHDYFNISSLGGFSQLYQWIEINFFNGTAPLPFFIVFNIMMYNVIIDLIFLLYSVFMFFIDFAEKCLDRFYGRSNS